MSLLSCPRARQFYLIGSLHPPGHLVSAAALCYAVKGHIVLTKELYQAVQNIT
jgi:hypothetical protein